LENQNPSKTKPALRTAAPKTDNNRNIDSTWKVATRPSESRSPQTTSSPKPKKQPKTQKATLESRNFRHGKSHNLKIFKKHR
jgi:hypothetical protein